MIVNTLVVFYISNFNTFIESILINEGSANIEEVTWYTDIFGVVMLSGIIFAPLYGIAIQFYQKKHKDQSVAGVKSCLLGIGCSCVVAVLLQVCMLIPSANLQIFSMFLVILLKAFYFSANSSFLSLVLPPHMIGSLYGILSLANGCVLLLQQPLRLLVTDYLKNNFMPVNCGLLALSLLLFLHPVVIRKSLKNIKNEKKKKVTNVEEMQTFCKAEDC